MKSTIIKSFLLTGFIFMLSAGVQAQYFPSGYFEPVKISAQPRDNNSFWYASYGIIGKTDLEYFTENIGLEPLKDFTARNFTLVWFKNSNPNNKAGFELLFNYESWTNNLSEWNDYWKTYEVKLSSVGPKGTAWSLYGTRDIYDVENGLWGFGAEVTFGGHPFLTKGKSKLPFSLTFGERLSYQQRPLGFDETQWTDAKDYYGSDYAYGELYAKMAFQYFSYKNGVRLYFKTELEATWETYYMITPLGYWEDDVYRLKAGFAIGLMY